MNWATGLPSSDAIVIAVPAAWAPPANSAATSSRVLSILVVVMLGAPYFLPAHTALVLPRNVRLDASSLRHRSAWILNVLAEFLDVLVME